MKLYSCSNCQTLLYFENNICLNCGHTVGFDPTVLSLVTLAPENNNIFSNILDKKQFHRFCKNSEYGTCNWLIPANQDSPYCQACSLNRVIPDLNTTQNLRRWKSIEIAKHRLIYSLLRLRLPIAVKKDNEEEGLAFDFMADTSPKERVMTGHDNGTITLNIEEADETERVRHKLDLGEKYRTLLGHFRHEIGHYYWDVLVKNSNWLERYRSLYGDERRDYSEALESYYKTGAPANWSDHFISPYATSHSWEDWAESWAHYLHMMDTLETAYSFGVNLQPKKENDQPLLRTAINQDPYTIREFSSIIELWIPLTFAVNSLNRSMGYQDFYPFVIPPPVVEKQKFIHELLFSGS